MGKQFAIASGERISNLKIREKGYGLEVRINAEKAVQDVDGNVSFIPTPGEITECILPKADDIELISTVAKGKVVSPFYDSLIIQIICHGKSRQDVISKMYAYLDSITIPGICTNVSLIKRILMDQTFIDGNYDTNYLPEFLSRIDASTLIQEIEEGSGSDSSALDPEMIRIEGSDEIKVLAPSTGVFYLTPSPSEPEYINLGDVISTDDIMCQLEAMKMFSPVTLNSFSTDTGELYLSDQKYRVTRINLNSGQQVNEGDLLFVIKPV